MLDAVDAPGLRRQSQPAEQVGRKLALVGEIVHGEHGRRTTVAAIGEIGHREPGLPVMAVQNIRREARDGMNADLRGDPSERAEAERVVGPVAAVVRHIRIALPAEEMRRIQHEQIEAADLGGEHARPAAEQVVDREDFVRLPEARPSPRDSRAPA